MMNDSIFEGNRAAWNEALHYHQKARDRALHLGFAQPGFSTFDRDCDGVLLRKLEELDLANKVIAQMPCNNGRELLSLMHFGAKEAVGFDISDAAIQEAKELNDIAGLNATFERCNLLEIGPQYNGYFDFIYVSEGSLQWFPDLEAYFAVISRVLKKGGRILLFEMHPFAYFFENGFDPEVQNWDALPSYFDSGPYHYQKGIDYIGGVEYDAQECNWFFHTLSDLFRGLRLNGILVEDFEEYNLEMANHPGAKLLKKFPLSYLLTGEKRAQSDNIKYR